MQELIINPTFKNLVPAPTQEELDQLEENIVRDGVIRDPIVVWNGIIVDGHNRYEIIKKHPEIPYEVKKMSFDSEDDAIVWICDNQLGRRNITANDRMYLLGKRMEAEKKISGGDHCSSEFRNQREQKGPYDREKDSTSGRLAKEESVSPSTVQRAQDFASGVDKADEISPGIGQKIRSGEVKATKGLMEMIPKAEPVKQKKVVEELEKGNQAGAREILTPSRPKLEEAPVIDENDLEEEVEAVEHTGFAKENYTDEDLLMELRSYMRDLDLAIQGCYDAHGDLMNGEGYANAVMALDEGIDVLKDWKSKLEEAGQTAEEKTE